MGTARGGDSEVPTRDLPTMPHPRPQYSRFAALVLSFFSPALYRDVARRWRGIGLLYLLLLMAVTWAPVVLRWHVQFRTWAHGGQAARYFESFPSVDVENGVVSIAEPQPHVWRDPDAGEVILVVDASAEFDVPEAATARMLLSRRILEVRDDEQRTTHVFNLKRVEDFHLDRESALCTVQRWSNRFGLYAFPTAMLVSMAWGLVRVLMYAFLGKLLAVVFPARLDYPALVRLSAVAMTPGMVVDAAGWMLGVGATPYYAWSVMIGVITAAYLAFAVRANAEAGPALGAGEYVPGYGLTPGAPSTAPRPLP